MKTFHRCRQRDRYCASCAKMRGEREGVTWVNRGKVEKKGQLRDRKGNSSPKKPSRLEAGEEWRQPSRESKEKSHRSLLRGDSEHKEIYRSQRSRKGRSELWGRALGGRRADRRQDGKKRGDRFCGRGGLRRKLAESGSSSKKSSAHDAREASRKKGLVSVAHVGKFPALRVRADRAPAVSTEQWKDIMQKVPAKDWLSKVLGQERLLLLLKRYPIKASTSAKKKAKGPRPKENSQRHSRRNQKERGHF